MKFLLSNYGHGSQKDGVKSFKTLRGEIDPLEDGIQVVSNGVSSGGKAPYYDSLKLKGRSIKTGEAVDNDVSLSFYDLTEDECIELSSRLFDYALQNKMKEASSPVKYDEHGEVNARYVELQFSFIKMLLSKFLKSEKVAERLLVEGFKQIQYMGRSDLQILRLLSYVDFDDSELNQSRAEKIDEAMLLIRRAQNLINKEMQGNDEYRGGSITKLKPVK